MNDIIVALPIADDIVEPRPNPSAKMADDGTNIAYLYNGTDISEWPVTAWIVGTWDESTGEPLGAITSDYFDWIRPIGNDGGVATGVLRPIETHLAGNLLKESGYAVGLRERMKFRAKVLALVLLVYHPTLIIVAIICSKLKPLDFRLPGSLGKTTLQSGNCGFSLKEFNPTYAFFPLLLSIFLNKEK